MTKDHFVHMCENRRYTFEECKGAIVKEEKDLKFVDHEKKEIIADGYYIDDEHKDFPHASGVGTELKKLFSMIGLKATPTCSCNRKAMEYDHAGIRWCKNNIETILSGLEEESKKRKIPFIKFAAEQVVKIAIKRAERNPRSRP